MTTSASNTKAHAVLVLDIGKTNVKLHVLSMDDSPLADVQMPNKIVSEGLYPHSDVDGIWHWMLAAIKTLSATYAIQAISITTHGATAALINRNQADASSALVLPVLDYEYATVENCNEEYLQHRPDFSESFSPNLPMGLNLGRQLFWLKKNFPTQFARATDILMYPQYWAWRLTGERCTEVTSLGCHTDLWDVAQNTYSSLVISQEWQSLFPPIKAAWDKLGCVKDSAALASGLSETCRVHVGVHDSNASFLRYKLAQAEKSFTVISSGTWTILMSSGSSLTTLDPTRDMLANIDVTAKPVACARFMGGREFEVICNQLKGQASATLSSDFLQQLIATKIMALPDFSEGSGPFGGLTGAIINLDSDATYPPELGAAIATLYSALMVDYQLDQLQATGDIYIEGTFLRNPILCGLLAQLRPQQAVYLSTDTTGTVQGCARLTHWAENTSSLSLIAAETTDFSQLTEYKHYWLSMVKRHGQN